MRAFGFISVIGLFLLGVAMIAYCAHIALYSMWLSAHPHFDDRVWFARAMLWLMAAVGFVAVELLGARWLLKGRRYRVPNASAHSPGRSHDRCAPPAF